MKPEIKFLNTTILVGMQSEMSLINNQTGALWGRFMPRRKEISIAISSDLYSVQFYPSDYFKEFNPAAIFRKFAGVAIENEDGIPHGMEVTRIDGGKYAVFHYKGLAGNPAPFQYIYSQWLPQSGYILDDRPHFEVLGEKYNNINDESEEEIWIPLKY